MPWCKPAGQRTLWGQSVRISVGLGTELKLVQQRPYLLSPLASPLLPATPQVDLHPWCSVSAV